MAKLQDIYKIGFDVIGDADSGYRPQMALFANDIPGCFTITGDPEKTLEEAKPKCQDLFDEIRTGFAQEGVPWPFGDTFEVPSSKVN